MGIRELGVGLLTASLLMASGAIREAGASVTIDLIFRGTNTNLTTAVVGAPVTADVVLTTGVGTILSSVSVGWDLGFGLTVSSALQWIGGKFPDNTPGPPSKVTIGTLGSPTINNLTGRAGSFTARCCPGTPNAPPALGPGTWNIGTVVWDTTGAVPLSLTQVFAVLRPVDQIRDANGTDISGSTTLNNGFIAVIPIPEPGTAALFALGIAALAASARRRGSR